MERATETLKLIVSWIVAGDYHTLESYSAGKRLTAEMMRDAVLEYGRKVVMPPQSAFESFSIEKIEGMTETAWAVTFDLWTEEEGASDLSLECTFIERGNEFMDVEVDGLHVL